MEGAMWRERFTRRIEERDRRKKARESDLARRRSLPEQMEEEEEADQRSQKDDEEVRLNFFLRLVLVLVIITDEKQIFRRLVVLQQSRARHAQLVSHQIETGGSDPDLPDFWDDDEDSITPLTPQGRIRGYAANLGDVPISPAESTSGHRDAVQSYRDYEDEEERWAREAAEAEEAELDAEQLEMARRVEEQCGALLPKSARQREDEDVDMDMDWAAFDSMDIE